MAKIVGNYELTSELGAGAFAVVFKSRNLATGKPYAIKSISKAKVGDPKLIEQEIAIMQKYSHLHENIVQYFEHFSSQRHIYLVLEFCPGGDLSKYIKTRGRLTEEIARGFLKQISNGLHFLHSKNIMHRDLKPANILLSEDSRHAILKIADFGIAKQLRGAVSMSRTQVGTPLYMAPEIYEMQGYDAKADVWSVGCIFYEMLVGCPPFMGHNPGELLHKIRTKQLQNPSNVLVGADSWSLVRKLLERSPHRRASLDQLREACGGVRPTPRAGGDVRRDHDHFRSKPKEKVFKVAKRYVPEFKQHQQHQHRPLHPGLHLHYHQHHHHYQGHHHNHYCQQFAVALPTLPLLPALPALPLLPLLPALPLLPTMPAFQECGWGDDYDGLGWLWG